ncbi:MAG: hypothetical protein HOH33_06265, partial [Verrucomicrobia bacterium]|nr:hypothetical protein [Verrucomicrobiota bacterium]
QKMALGAPFAVAMLEMGDTTDIYREAPRMLSIMGDPTLRLHTLRPPSNLIGRFANEQVTLEWEASPEEDTQYFVYRKNPVGGFQLLNSTPLDETSFIDENPSFVDPDYMIRAVKPQVSGSGSYNNLSQAIYSKME